MKHGLYMGRPDQLSGQARGFDGPAHVLFRTKTCVYADVIFNAQCLFFVVGSRLDSVGQMLSANEAHNNQYPLLTQSYSTNDSVGWLPVGHHLVLLQHPQQQQEQQQHVLLPGQERHAACVAETARSVACTPTTVPRL